MTIAPEEAILLMSDDIGDDYYEEADGLVGRFKLGKVQVVESLASTMPVELRV